VIGIIDYGSGNVAAITRVYKNLNIPTLNITKPDQLVDVDRIILPGVGAFDYTMSLLRASGFKSVLEEHVVNQQKPILGICVGLQIMGSESDEGREEGFGWISGKVKKFSADKINSKPKLPHMGWNTVTDLHGHPLLSGIEHDLGFYFIHSYYMNCENNENVLTTTEYGVTFSSSIYKNNIFGVQFHPEKSHKNGILVFKNFSVIPL
jgi:glutamine amidotransferase